MRCGYGGCKLDFCGSVRARDGYFRASKRPCAQKQSKGIRLFLALSRAEQIVGILICGGLRFAFTEIFFGVPPR
jgi:hypothetical protein